MFYFRCGKETGRFKFFRQTDSTYGNTDRMQLLFIFTNDISILAPPRSKGEIPMCQSYVSLRKNRVQLPAFR